VLKIYFLFFFDLEKENVPLFARIWSTKYRKCLIWSNQREVDWVVEWIWNNFVRWQRDFSFNQFWNRIICVISYSY
jgi:hypothetical protein